jgi:hypothetical protein
MADPTTDDYTFNRVARTQITIALPAAASSTVYTADIDLGVDNSKGLNGEWELAIPALTAVMLPNTKTMTANVYAGAAASPTTILYGSVAVSTGADAAGSAATTGRFRLPSNCPRYIRVGFVSGADVTDSSTVNGQVDELV